MAQQIINVGTSANKGDGDPLRLAFQKVNNNFTEIYNKISVLEDGTIAVQGFVKGTLVADDSSILVDGVAGKVVGPVEAPTITSSSYVDANSINANVYGVKTVGSFINFGVNASSVNVTTNIDMLTNNITNVGSIAGHISIADLQTLVAASVDFDDFKTRIAAL